MLILYRLTPIAIALTIAAAFALIISGVGSVIWTMVLSSMVIALLLARLLRWESGTFQFWNLLVTPLLFLLSSFGLLLFLEQPIVQLVLGLIVLMLVTLFVEHVFTFMHLPALYQPFSIEHLGQLMNIFSMFFISSVGFGLRLFLQLPLWILGIVFFLVCWYMVYGTLWASKVESNRARPYALAGAVLMSQLFIAVSFLPSGFYTSAAFIAIGFYIFLGLTRASAQRRLSKNLLRRYVTVTIVLSLVVAATSQWL